MSMAQWNQQARKVLKGAKISNDFFNIEAFEDSNFPIKIPLEYAQLIDKNNPDDPLLKQVMPQASIDLIGFSQAPLNDEENSPVAGLIHKYTNRVLLITSQVCAIHWNEIEQYIQADKKVNEVILSGGDPLSLSDDKLKKLIHNIENIKHINAIRIHTRSAVVMPSRITTELANLLRSTRLKVVMVFHVNHSQELSAGFVQQITKLKDLTLLNQAVLLKGVNDHVDTLKKLSLDLFKVGILPYYLHMLDPVSGAERYFIEDEVALKLHQRLKSELSGYLVPRLVRDEGKSSKSWLL
jgi:L-lysine 2,3-aminomutase